MIHYYKSDGKSFIPCNKEDPELYWVELTEPSTEEIEEIVMTYKIPRDYIYDIKDTEEIARVEGLDDEGQADLFMMLFPFRIDDSSVAYDTRAISVILGEDFFITAVEKGLSLFPLPKDVKSTAYPDIYIKREHLVLEIAWKISQKFLFAVEDLSREIKVLEEKIRTSSKTEDYYDIIALQKSLIILDLAIKANGPIMSDLLETPHIFTSPITRELLHDLQVEYRQADVMITKESKILEQISDLYSAVISNNLNMVMKVLTSITIVLTVPTIVGGLWGMNMKLPLASGQYSFYYLCAIIVILCVAIILWLRKRDYL